MESFEFYYDKAPVEVRDNIRFFTKNADGSVYGHIMPPNQHGNFWSSGTGEGYYICQAPEGPEGWRDSVVVIPFDFKRAFQDFLPEFLDGFWPFCAATTIIVVMVWGYVEFIGNRV